MQPGVADLLETSLLLRHSYKSMGEGSGNLNHRGTRHPPDDDVTQDGKGLGMGLLSFDDRACLPDEETYGLRFPRSRTASYQGPGVAGAIPPCL
ncbi:hypothetical protein SSPO_000920 [Streptomyces antimycoticus]|uniref:Uncharacterized protein n=1 Tax=Streptomyces antimycoticus TaxID=68175 RepID=A0A499U9R5_9ACTN|nr:hypothetical protein SSPO_000920 [Streptomyces antimycoticus]